jgi:hypothetical protein
MVHYAASFEIDSTEHKMLGRSQQSSGRNTNFFTYLKKSSV